MTMAATAEVQYHTSGVVPLTRPQLIGTLIGLLLAALLAAIDQTIVGTAEPRIIAQLSGFNRYPWIATAYLLTSTVSVPIFASLSDIHGRKPFFLVGATLFVATSALCGAAGTLTFLPLDGMGQLILFRGLQGVGAGMVMGLLFTIVGDIFSPAERGRYQGLFAAVWGVASIFGPTLGGWLTANWSWRAWLASNRCSGCRRSCWGRSSTRSPGRRSPSFRSCSSETPSSASVRCARSCSAWG